MQIDNKLINACIKNERKAQKKLYDMYAPVLLGLCCRYTQDRSEAEDVLQEAFIKIYKNLDQFADKGSFEGWLKRIVVNTAITHYRKNQKHAFQEDISEIQESRISGDSFIESEFTRDELMTVINSLPRGYKMVFNLYAIEGYKHKEIAEMINIDINTSKSQYSRARKLIQEKLEKLVNYDL